MNKTILGLLLTLAIPTLSFGQGDIDSWQNLRRIKAGNTIRIIQVNAPDIHGKFLESSPTEVFIEVDKRKIPVQRANVHRIDVRKGYKRVLRALAGAGVGAAVGLAVFAGSKSEDTFYGVALPLFPVLVGAGTVVGALRPGYSTIYKAP